MTHDLRALCKEAIRHVDAGESAPHAHIMGEITAGNVRDFAKAIQGYLDGAGLEVEHLATALCEQYSSNDCNWPNCSCKTNDTKRDKYKGDARRIIEHVDRIRGGERTRALSEDDIVKKNKAESEAAGFSKGLEAAAEIVEASCFSYPVPRAKLAASIRAVDQPAPPAGPTEVEDSTQEEARMARLCKAVLADAVRDGREQTREQAIVEGYLRLLRAGKGWEPIASAPKDGTKIEYWHPKWEMTSTCKWIPDEYSPHGWWDESMTEVAHPQWWRHEVIPPEDVA